MARTAVMKTLAKRALYRSGALDLYRRAAQADALTVVMFHRVLPPSDPRFETADPAYTMRLATFEHCLDAFTRHYNVVALDAVSAALRGTAVLPKRALLVTFDDGWEDTARYAVPALHRRSLPSVVFVTSGALSAALTLWQDAAACLWRASETVRQAHPTTAAMVAWLSQRPPAEREAWLHQALAKSPKVVEPLMMTPGDLARIETQGAAIGGHGATHTSLTEIADVDGEAERCRRELTEAAGRAPTAFAFPNGRYSPLAVAAVARAAFSLQFTSEPWLNKMRKPRGEALLGRIDIPETAVVDARGDFDEERLLYWLTMRPVRPVGGGLTP